MHFRLRFSYSFFLSFLLSLIYGYNMGDESWFLHVVSRFLSGDVLYQDVFFGITPLSVYITAAFVRVFGVEILVVKACEGLCFALIALMSCKLGRQLGIIQRFSPLLAVAILVCAPPTTASLYQPLATIFYLAGFSNILAWQENWKSYPGTAVFKLKDLRAPITAGILSGFCFLSKQNIGFLSLFVTLLAIAVHHRQWKRKKLFRDLFVVLISFLFVSFLFLLPVVLSGGFTKFLEYGFINRGTYLRYAGISFFTGLTELRIAFFLPLLTFPALMALWIFGDGKARCLTTLVLLFVGGAFLGIFPRADWRHLVYATPELLLGLIYALHKMKPNISKAKLSLIKLGIILALGIGGGILFIKPAGSIVLGTFHLSSLPHFRGVPTTVAQENQIREHIKVIKEVISEDEHTFFLTPYAGFYYLVTGIKNPTPFDFPLISAFGLNGENEVIEAISQLKIRNVCLTHWDWALTPTRLENYVRESMVLVRDLGFCTLYRSRTPKEEENIIWKAD